ncbi:MAG: asparaginase [Paracoccaceae bacterium]
MTGPTLDRATDAPLAHVTRGDLMESVHRGHAVVHDGRQVRAAWGDPGAVIYPRSSAKPLQVLPLLEADQTLSPRRVALACASHQGAPIHVEMARDWLAAQGLDEGALACGPQATRDRALRDAMIRDGAAPGRLHNNCSGKHAGFLALAGHMGAPHRGYEAADHPVQRAVRAAFEEMVGEDSPGWGIDGCSAPNFACTVGGLARAMARMARAGAGSGTRDAAMARARDAMIAHPDLVAGEGRACTDIMRALGGAAMVKTGAEGVYVACLPGLGLGVALKVSDGATRAAEIAVAGLLARLGLELPTARILRNFAGQEVGELRALV